MLGEAHLAVLLPTHNTHNTAYPMGLLFCADQWKEEHGKHQLLLEGVLALVFVRAAVWGWLLGCESSR